MTVQTFDALSRRTAGLSRRGSLLTLGAASVAALAGPTTAEARKSGKKAIKKAKKQAKKKCKRQIGQCEIFVDNLCDDDPNSEVCVVRLSPCCQFFANCQATAFFECIFENAG